MKRARKRITPWVIIFGLLCVLTVLLLTLIIGYFFEGIIAIAGAISFSITFMLYSKVNTGGFRFLWLLKFWRFATLMLCVTSVFAIPLVIKGILEVGVIKMLKSLIIGYGLLVGICVISHLILRLLGDKSSLNDLDKL